MSLALVGRQNATSGELYLPSYGSWRARVHTDNETELTGDASVTIGDLVMQGTIESGGVSGALGTYLVRGGLAWDTVIDARAYQSDTGSGVRLRTLITDAAQDAGVALASVDFPPDVRAGSAWERAEAPARGLLGLLRAASLAPPWYVSPAGRTVFAERAGGSVAAVARVKRRALDLGIRYIRVDSYAPWVPGLSFEGAVIDYVRFSWTPEDVTVELGAVRT